MFWIIVIACGIAWLFVFLPSLIYLNTTWKIRLKNLMSRFNQEAIQLYLKKYFPSETVPTAAMLNAFFAKKIKSQFGPCQYIMPFILLVVISAIAITLVTISVLGWLEIRPDFKPLPPIAISAILGAFMWVAFDQLQRFRTGDFTSHDIYNCTYRFLIAVPMGFSFAATVKDPVGVPLAFFLGTFPTKTLMTFGKRFVTKHLDIGDQAALEKGELEQIQGINKLEAERFKEEGVTNIVQLAYMNPIDLTLRTNYDFNYVIDCMSQGLLWIYLDKNMENVKLRVLGLRGAYEAKVLSKMLASSESGQKQIADADLAELAKVLEVSKEAFQKTLLEVAEDPYTTFIYNIWDVDAE
jgi:hypothetical protein